MTTSTFFVAARRAARTVVAPALLGGLLIGVWYFITYAVLTERNRFMLRPPHRVLTVGFLDWENLSEILGGLVSTVVVASIGLGVSILIGFSVAIAMSQTRIIESAMYPYLVMLQAVPMIALVPLIQTWAGSGQLSRVIVCVLITLFPIIVNTLFGLQSVDPAHDDLFRLRGAGRWVRLRKLTFPGALPAIFAGLRIAAGLSVIGAIVGDFFFGAGRTGLGQLLRKYATNLDNEQLIAAVFVAAALGVAVFLFFRWLEQRAIGAWHDSDPSGT